MEDNNTRKLKSNIGRAFLVISFSVLLLYVIINAIRFIQKPTEVFIVREGKISSEETVEGYIIRDEIVLEGENYKNGMVQIKTEGERVAKGEYVFRYYSNGEEELKEKIADLDIKISEALENETSPFSNDIDIIEKQIDSQLEGLYQNNEIQKINEFERNINDNIIKKSKIAGELSASGSYISDLINERNSYEDKLTTNSEILTADESGVVSYKVDGYEEVMKSDDFSYLSEDFLNSIEAKTGALIENNNEKGKIVNNFVSYIAVIGTSERALETKEGDKVKVRLSNLDEVTGEVVYTKDDNNKKIIVFKINGSVQYLINYRKVSLDIIWWSNSGKKVLNSCIVEKDDLSYVLRNRAGIYESILVKVKRQNENYSIVDNYTKEELEKMGYSQDEIKDMTKLKLYDEIVLNPTKEMLQ